MSMQALREQRAAKAKSLHDVLNAEEFDSVRSDELLAEIEAIDGRISAMQRALDKQAEDKADTIELESMKRRADKGGPDSRAVFNRFLRVGHAGLNADELQVFRNVMSTGVGAEGGFTVPEEVANAVIDQMKAFGGVREVATVLRTAAGNDINFPTSNGTSEEGELVGENAAATSQDITFGVVAHKVYRYSSKKLAVPIELLMDSAVDIEAFVRGRLVTRLGRITNKHFTLGTGTNQPRGVQVGASQGVIAANSTSQVTAVTYDSLVDVQHSVDPAYRAAGNTGWMFNDDTLAKTRKIKDQQNRPIFVPGYEVGVPGGAPDTLLGRPITINQDMPNMAASVKSILFGDFSYYYVRDVLDVSIRRYTDSAFDLNGQVGFCGFLRTGGNLLEPAAVKFFQNAAS